MSLTNKNGVVPRRNNVGDQWAACHRSNVDAPYKMTDIDGMFGAMFYERDTSDQVFMEYIVSGAPGGFRYGVTAIIERKAYIPEKHDKNRYTYEMQRGFLCWLARTIGTVQTVVPRVLYIVGDGHSEWTMARIDPSSEASTGERWVLTRDGSWMDIWDKAGMVDVRIALRDLVP